MGVGGVPALTSPVMSLGLRLPGNGVHDGILRVHADGRVVLGVDDGGLPSGTLHLDGLVGGEGRVLQGDGVEAGGVLHAEVRGQWEGGVKMRGYQIRAEKRKPKQRVIPLSNNRQRCRTRNKARPPMTANADPNPDPQPQPTGGKYLSVLAASRIFFSLVCPHKDGISPG